MLQKILEDVKKHIKKFNYMLTSTELNELIELYLMNHETYDEKVLALFIEKYISRGSEYKLQLNWQDERRQSVCGHPIRAEALNAPKFKKQAHESEFIFKALGQEIPFSLLSNDQKNRLVSSMYPILVKAGTTLIKQYEFGSQMYIVEYGEFDIIVDGKFVTRLYRGAKFGELALLHRILRTSTVVAVVDSKVWAAEQESFLAIRYTDNLYKRKILRSVFEENEEIRKYLLANNIEELLNKITYKVIVAFSNVILKPEEVLIILKDDAQIEVDGKVCKLKAKDIIRYNFKTLTTLECGILNLKHIKQLN